MDKVIFNIFCVSLAAYLSGCASSDTPANPAFFADDQPSSVRQVAYAQATAGARADGMLSVPHFTADKLSGLGIAKLQMMLADNASAFPVMVYVNLPADDVLIAARQAAVASYLTDAGLRGEQFKVVVGANPATLHRAVPAKPESSDSKAAMVMDMPPMLPKK